MNLLQPYWKILDKQLRYLAVIAVILLGLNGLFEGTALLVLLPALGHSLTYAEVVGKFLTHIFNTSNTQDLILPFSFLIFIILASLSSLVRFFSTHLILHIRSQMERLVQEKSSKVILSIDWAYFTGLHYGDLEKGVNLEGRHIADSIYASLQGLGTSLITFFYLCVASYVSVQMTLYTLLFCGVILSIYLWARKRTDSLIGEFSQIASHLASSINTLLGQFKFFRSTGYSHVSEQKISQLRRSHLEKQLTVDRYPFKLRLFFELFAIGFITFFLVWWIYLQKNSILQTLIFLAIFYRIVPNFSQIQELFFRVRRQKSWLESWQERIEFAKQHPVKQSGEIAPSFQSNLTLQDVSFKYPLSKTNVLTQLNLIIHPQECLAIVGKSGSGKTSLIDLLTGLLTPQTGTLTLDGTLFHDLKMDDWRKHIGIVSQENPVFHTSVLENIAWGKDEIDTARIIDCLERAHAWEFVQKLPQGLNTKLGERGIMLSGGQRQRIAIARALYTEPWLLILDEATSALDSESENQIQLSLQEQKHQFAMIIIAHRLNTIRIADKIIVLEEGRIVEQGTWNELSKKQGTFYSMLQYQGHI